MDNYGFPVSEQNRFWRQARCWRTFPCSCSHHKALRARGGEVTADDILELVDAHRAGERRRARRLAWFRARPQRRGWRRR